MSTEHKLNTSHLAYISYAFIHFFSSSLGQSFLLGIFLGAIGDELNASPNEISSYYVIATIASAFTIPLVGKKLDTVPIRTFSLFTIIGLLLASVGFSLISTKWLLPLGFYGLRLFGQGLMPFIGSTGIARYFTAHRGKALSFSVLGVTAAEGILPLLIPFLIGSLGWRQTFVYLSIAVAALFLLSITFLIKRDSPFQTAQKTTKTKHSGQKTFTWKFYSLVLAYTLPMFFLTGLFIHQHHVAKIQGWDPVWFASTIAIYGTVRLIANLGAGFIVDWFSAKTVFRFALVPILIGMAVFLLGSAQWSVVVALALCGTSTSLGSISNSALWAELFGPEHLGQIKSKVSKFMIISTALGTYYFGFMVEKVDSLTWIVTPCIIAGVLFFAGANIAIGKLSKAQ